ncbi:MAG: hypothetical protein CL928_02860 [Deltaproteobacteria bacterium]|nr:hypothetical protein [Deltaproteobacteria bacterium]
MELFSVVFGGLSAVLFGLCLWSPAARPLWSGITRRDLGVYGATLLGAVALSLFHFDAIGHHAFRPHEESYYFALQGEAPPGGWFPLETQVLLRLIYQGVGQVLGSTMTVFVGTALLAGLWSPLLMGLAAQLLSRRAWVGWCTAVLVAFHPDLSYWRVHAFQIAPPHVAFAATVLLSVLVARKPTGLHCTAWLVLGAFALFLRQDNLGAVVATAAIPALAGQPGFLRHWKLWVPGFLLAAALLAIPTLHNISLAVDREDYRWGFRFLPYHLAVMEAYRPLTTPGILALVGLGLGFSFRLSRVAGPFSELQRACRAWAVFLPMGLFPDLLFSEFGARHLLGTTTAALALAATGTALVFESPWFAHTTQQRQRATRLVLGAMLLAGIGASWLEIVDQGRRYGDDTPEIPTLPGTERPTLVLDDSGEPLATLPPELKTCGLYSGETYVCDPWAEVPDAVCHPPKNLREPDEVRNLWDQRNGCVLWAVDDTCDDVSGVMHDWWEMVRSMYQWEPAGILPIQERNAYVEVYRLVERP